MLSNMLQTYVRMNSTQSRPVIVNELQTLAKWMFVFIRLFFDYFLASLSYRDFIDVVRTTGEVYANFLKNFFTTCISSDI